MDESRLIERLSKLEAQVEGLTRTSDKVEGHYQEIIRRLSEIKVIEQTITGQSENLVRAFQEIAESKALAQRTDEQFKEYVAKIKGMTKMAWFVWSVMGAMLAYALALLTDGGVQL